MKKVLLAYATALIIIVGCNNQQENDEQSFTIHTIGDSTMANKKDSARPETGWGECITNHVVDTNMVKVINYAVNGRSSKSFINEGRWDAVKANIKNGDYVLIQFGHNDQKDKDTTRFTNASTIYKENLRKYVKESRELGATPILLTSIVRRNFNEYGNLIDTHKGYPDAVRQVANEMNVYLVDAQLISEKLVIAFGPEESKKLYNHVEVGHENYPDGKEDNTHLNQFGAQTIARLLIDDLKKLDIKLEKTLK